MQVTDRPFAGYLGMMAAAEAPSTTTRVLVIDRHPVSRRGLSREIEVHPQFDVVAAVGEIDDGLRLARDLHPDVAVYGISDDDEDPVGATRALRTATSGVAVLVFGGRASIADAVMAAGAAGSVTKSAPVPVVLGAIAAVARGESVIGRSPFDDGGDATATASRDDPPLTAREWEVLHLLDEGCNAARIGERLFISRNTARNYIQSVLTKLGAHSKLEAVAVARRSGLLGHA